MLGLLLLFQENLNLIPLLILLKLLINLSIKQYNNLQMKFKDLKFLQKIKYSVEIFMDMLSFTRIYTFKFNNLQSVLQQRKILNFYKFNTPKCLYQWIPSNDRDIGGNSESQVIFQNDKIIIKGNIVDQDKDKLITLPYVGMKMIFPLQKAIYLSRFNILQLRVKTDGNIYKLVCNFKMSLSGEIQVAGNIVDQSEQWQVLQLPIVLFEKHRDLHQNNFENTSNFNVSLNSMEILTYSQISKSIRFQIQQINLIYDPNLNSFIKKYKRPLFFKSNVNYLKPQIIDTGRQTLKLKNK